MSAVPTFAEPEELADLVRNPEKAVGKDYAIVDVRGNDYIGGHIPGSINVPAAEMYDRANELIDKLEGIPTVYFHCALSQVRGPKSARIYKETMYNLGKSTDQKVKVVRNGFEGWQAKYKNEKDLLEDYDPAVWEWGTMQ
ncbi:Rhodanese-like protein [Backusella circina FSU 941]|nr:Rhodanese-like protein [Backusella circina FSU 941]